jgi:hypothetical protein
MPFPRRRQALPGRKEFLPSRERPAAFAAVRPVMLPDRNDSGSLRGRGGAGGVLGTNNHSWQERRRRRGSSLGASDAKFGAGSFLTGNEGAARPLSRRGQPRISRACGCSRMTASSWARRRCGGVGRRAVGHRRSSSAGRRPRSPNGTRRRATTRPVGRERGAGRLRDPRADPQARSLRSRRRRRRPRPAPRSKQAWRPPRSWLGTARRARR